MRDEATIVVPCFNERARLDTRAFLRLSVSGGARLVLVDDGSTDGTGAALESLAARHPAGIDVLPLERNVGKAEAVRRGLLRALDGGAEIVGYLDADLSTPVAEMERLLARLRSSSCQVLFGSRVKLLGRTIERRMSRHYSGRVFATVASMILHLGVYDTQCGAKLFRRSPALLAALEKPFRSRWAFDVELLQRLLRGCDGVPGIPSSDVLEEPLEVWRDVPGSKLHPVTAVLAGLSLFALAGPSLRGIGRRAARRIVRPLRSRPAEPTAARLGSS